MSRRFLSPLEGMCVAGLAGLLGTLAGLLVGGPVGALAGGIVAGVHGAIAGWRGVYDWRHPRGWFALVADSTWGLVGTALGTLLIVANIAMPSANLESELTCRRNRHLHNGGFSIRRGFAFTLGSAISNADPNGYGLNDEFLSRHEELHVWQNRIFGPLFQLTYVLWALAGVVVAVLVWLRHRDVPLRKLIETACYYNNPFEYWAYRNDGNWPPRGAHPLLAWSGPESDRTGAQL
ncbi:MAG: hypothetical protein IT175_01455 [Acidobacteria bacterium]|nr:hypothetical protein [Acidobacteriota bacterium]